MKKTVIIALLIPFFLLIGKPASAQQLPASGDRTFEVTVSPFSANPVSFTQIRLRSFRSTDQALRLRTNITYDSERDDEDTRDSRLNLLLSPGMEWHAAQFDRVSIYYGAELPIQFVTSRAHREDVTNKNIQGGEHFGIGLNGLVGLDVHFLNRLYTGIEVMYGFMYRSYLDAEINENEIENDAADLTFGSSAITRFRLGIRF